MTLLHQGGSLSSRLACLYREFQDRQSYTGKTSLEKEKQKQKPTKKVTFLDSLPPGVYQCSPLSSLLSSATAASAS